MRRGVTVKPIQRLDGKPVFAEIFLDDVRIPIANRLGDEGQGWAVCMSTAGFERGLMLRSPRALSGRRCEACRALERARFRSAARSRSDAGVDGRRCLCAVDLCDREPADGGGAIGPETSTNKIFWSELDLDLHKTALSLLGAEAELTAALPGAAAPVADWLDGYVFSLAGPIYAGANEIQRNIIAERMLGMPR